MEQWYEILMNDKELQKEYYSKIYNDDSEEIELKDKRKPKRENSWVRNRKHRKKMVRKFLSLNPAMQIDPSWNLSSTNGLFYDSGAGENGGIYNINHVTHVFLAAGGHLEVFRGVVKWGKSGLIFELGAKNKDLGKITNRRIRHMKVDEGNIRYSTCKKCFSPPKEAF